MKKRIITIMSGLAGLAAILALFHFLHHSLPQIQFNEKGEEYHEAFSRACDIVLATYPIGTNVSIKLDPLDSSLPAIIREHNPDIITLSRNRIHLMKGAGRIGYGVVWEPSYTDARIWELSTMGDGEYFLIYTRKKNNS